MIKAVFLDWFNTLAHYFPPRSELHSQACRDLGVNVSPEAAQRGVLTADKYFWEENTLSPVGKRSPEEQAKVYHRYQQILLDEAGVIVSKELLLKIMARAHELFKGVTFALFDDVLPTLQTLKERKLTTGLLTNATKDMISIYAKLGLGPYLDFVVTSEEVESDKPHPPIFLKALERAGVDASEAIHVGDQYNIDIVGARGVGINPILIDRYDMSPDITDCPLIHTLPEIVEHL